MIISCLKVILYRIFFIFIFLIIKKDFVVFSSTQDDLLDFALGACFFVMSVSFALASQNSKGGNHPTNPKKGDDGPVDSIILDDDLVLPVCPVELSPLVVDKLYLVQMIRWYVSQIYDSFFQICNTYSIYPYKVQYICQYTLSQVKCLFVSLASLLSHDSFRNTGWLIDSIYASMKILDYVCIRISHCYHTIYGNALSCTTQIFSFFEESDKWYTYAFSKIFDLIEDCNGITFLMESTDLLIHTFGVSAIPLVVSTLFYTPLIPYCCRMALLYVGKSLVLKKLLKL